MKIIGIDAINIRGGGGITHLIELINHFPNKSNLGIVKIFIWGTKYTLNQIPDKPFLVKLHKPIFEKSLIHRTYFQIFKLSKIAKLNKCNVLFIPGGSFFGSFKPIVSMSQNLLPFEFNELKRYNFSQLFKLFLLRYTQSSTFRRSEGIIFLTNYARNTVFNNLKLTNSNTTIIPHGISKRFYSEPKGTNYPIQFTLDNPFKITYVSIIDMYKHQWNVVRAVYSLRLKGFNIVLNLIGPSFSPALRKLNTEIENCDSKKSWVNLMGPVNYSVINEYYLMTDLAVFASTCENLPIILLEKMASGLPIACSNRGPMPEVLSSGGIYFDPEDSKSIANAIEQYYLSGELRENMANISYNISKKYTWDFSSLETFKYLASFSKNSES